MSENAILAFVDKQEWLTPVQEKGVALVKYAYASAGEPGKAVKNFLNGVWLHHPLHAAITDVPVGSWTAAAVLDVLEASGQEQYAAGADAAIAVGLVGAVGSALSGITDWSDTYGKPQRLGAMHGLLNGGATLLYGTSYILRKTGQRSAARTLAFLGFALIGASSWLGGALSYTQRIGVNHSPDADEELPKDFVQVCPESELQEGVPKEFDVNGVPVMLLKRGTDLFALANACSHAGGPLAEGKVEGDTVVCPWHGSRFCLKDGSVVDGPATNPQPVLDVQVTNGAVLVRAQRNT